MEKKNLALCDSIIVRFHCTMIIQHYATNVFFSTGQPVKKKTKKQLLNVITC